MQRSQNFDNDADSPALHYVLPSKPLVLNCFILAELVHLHDMSDSSRCVEGRNKMPFIGDENRCMYEILRSPSAGL